VNRFWIILTVVVLGLVGLFIVTKPDESTTATFEGDASQVQADDHVEGNKSAKVTLIEYADFQCPSCAAAYPVLNNLKEKYKEDVQFVFRNFPLISIHPNAFSAARAAEAASKQDKFWEMHDKLFETQNLWGQISTNQQTTFEGYAKELGLNLEQFRADYSSEDVANKINRDASSGSQFSVQGTPTFILNGQKIENPRDQAGYEKVLDEAIKNNK
jgi:protein-disulfide isomerase